MEEYQPQANITAVRFSETVLCTARAEAMWRHWRVADRSSCNRYHTRRFLRLSNHISHDGFRVCREPFTFSVPSFNPLPNSPSTEIFLFDPDPVHVNLFIHLAPIAAPMLVFSCNCVFGAPFGELLLLERKNVNRYPRINWLYTMCMRKNEE